MATEQDRQHGPADINGQQYLGFGEPQREASTQSEASGQGEASSSSRPGAQPISDGPTSDGQPASNGQRERSEARPTSALIRELFDEGSAFVRAEIALARKEIQQNISSTQRGIGAMAGGGVVLLAGLHALIAAVILALALVWAAWAAALVVGLVTCAVGGILVAAGRRKTSAQNITPERTIRSFEENKRFARDESRRAMEKWR